MSCYPKMGNTAWIFGIFFGTVPEARKKNWRLWRYLWFWNRLIVKQHSGSVSKNFPKAYTVFTVFTQWAWMARSRPDWQGVSLLVILLYKEGPRGTYVFFQGLPQAFIYGHRGFRQDRGRPFHQPLFSSFLKVKTVKFAYDTVNPKSIVLL